MPESPAKNTNSLISSPPVACCFTLFSLAFTALFLLSDNRSSAWVSSLFPTTSHFSNVSLFDQNHGFSPDNHNRADSANWVADSPASSKKDGIFPENDNGAGSGYRVTNNSVSSKRDGIFPENDNRTDSGNRVTDTSVSSKKDGIFPENYNGTDSGNRVTSSSSKKDGIFPENNNGTDSGNRVSNSSVSSKKDGIFPENGNGAGSGNWVTNTSVSSKKDGNLGGRDGFYAMNNRTVKSRSRKGKRVDRSKEGDLWEKMDGCDLFDGDWVKDESYPLYEAGSCPHIDEPFDCFHNGRPDNGYEKFRWQPKGCNIPRFNGRNMLELLRGKRFVYVGDSLNRNMWESMVCTLRNVVKDKRKVFEASGRREFRTEGSYSFLFKDYNCSVEFFRSTFLVREWEMPDANGLKKETLRLDMVESSSEKFKNADILVFNTGHWWTHEKTSEGKGYYQEGGHVYDELNVMEAFRRAMTTWGRWIDANINPKKTLVFFRGYSASHFSGGQWNSGGQCDSETVPIKNETYLAGYPSIMSMLERVMSGMKTPVLYLNVTKMTDFRKDAHPSIYRSQQQHLTEEERKSPLRFQDCSHWCLPGVPETWNELLYAQIFTKLKKQQKKKQLQRSRH